MAQSFAVPAPLPILDLALSHHLHDLLEPRPQASALAAVPVFLKLRPELEATGCRFEGAEDNPAAGSGEDDGLEQYDFLSNLDKPFWASEGYTKRDLVEYFGLDERKIRVVHLGANKRYRILSKDRVNKIKAKFNISRPYLLSVGSVPRKNIENIISVERTTSCYASNT